MDRKVILDSLKEILANIRPKYDTSTVNEDTRLTEDLTIDSLMMFLLALAIETKFNITIASDAKFQTVGDVCTYIQGKTEQH